MRRVAKYPAGALAALICLFGIFLGYFTAAEWSPAAITPLDPQVAGYAAAGAVTDTVSVISWNIGYASLDAQADFFMDGGEMSRARSRDAVAKNLMEVMRTVELAAPDFALIQELDKSADRSFGVPQYGLMQKYLAGYGSVYARNYDVAFVPAPLLSPMGAVTSGIATFSRYPLEEARRHSLAGNYAWPKRLFHLKRCFSAARTYPAGKDGRPLVLVNLHLSAFDKGGFLRDKQLEQLAGFLAEMREAGASVIAGGDWNQILPGAENAAPDCPAGGDDLSWLKPLPPKWTPPGYRWLTDPARPTARTLGAPLNDETTCYAAIDGFLVSEDLRTLSVGVIDTGFANTDHLPVAARIRLPAGLPAGGPVAPAD